jgi:hypothetical protein
MIPDRWQAHPRKNDVRRLVAECFLFIFGLVAIVAALSLVDVAA